MHDKKDAAAAASLPTTMTAWRQLAYGGPETVVSARIDVPTPGRDEVLLRTRAVSLNSADVHLMRGEPRMVRLAFGLRRPKRPVLGMDVAGTVVALGEGVADWAVGDEVVGELPGGGLAEYVAAPVKRIVRRPEDLSAETAATLPLAGGTAWQALDRAHVGTGDRVLVIGASGGVGTFAVALAALRGAEVDALTGARSRSLVEGLGATRAFDYRAVGPGSAQLGRGGYDAVIDVVGAARLSALRALVREGGAAVLVGSGTEGLFDPLPRLAAASVRSIGSKRPLRPLAAVADARILSELLDLAASGALKPAIERTWPLAEAGAALAHVDAGHTLGKVVVTA
ncbi:NAD(P)-dependent alcohol dehydrogenase [Microbacterium awajiense]|uniref:NAD(P)-dependent alcohol dehydrogenase n=1 Tax=Microbacterium awajiense TaxID=415214 RepID=A0ABP7ASP4_9MICO